VPDGTGLWEDVFARLNKMVRLQRKEREQSAATLRHMEQATSALPEGVVILDEADRIEWCNPLAEQYFGLDGVRDAGQQITYLHGSRSLCSILPRAIHRSAADARQPP